MADLNDCNLSNFTIAAGLHIHFYTYHVLLPFYFIAGFAANIFLLLAFYKHSKIEHTYTYQVLLTISKTLEVFTFGTFLFGLQWFSGAFTAGSQWFQESYFLMFYTFRIEPTAHQYFIISSLLLSVAMAADRVFALTVPFKHKNINHSRHQIVAALICFALPATCTLTNAYYFKLIQNGTTYTGAVDEDYIETTLPVVCSRLGALTRSFGVIALIILNTVMIIKFRKRKMKVAPTENTVNLQREAVKKAREKTLVLLNLWQSVLMCVNQIPHILLNVMFFVLPNFNRCYGTTVAPLADACIMITDSIDILVIIAINKNMRRIMLDAFRCSGTNQASQEIRNNITNTRFRDVL